MMKGNTHFKQFEKLVEFSAEHIAMTDANGQVIYSNAAIEEILGYSLEEYYKLDFLSLVHPHDVQKFATAWEIVMQKHRAKHSVRFRCRNKDSNYTWLEVTIRNLLSDSDVQALVFVTRNINKRKLAEDALRYSASIQENMSDAVIVTDTKFTIQSWNKAAERIYGWKEEEVLGKSIDNVLQTQFVSPESAQEYVENFFEQGWTKGEFTQVHRDGSQLFVLSSVTLVHDEDGNPFAIVTVNHNITDRKKVEFALNQKLAEEVIFQSYLKDLHEISLELSLIDDLDHFYQRVVKLGVERFGFERLGLLLHDKQTGDAIGTFGTNADGNIVDERHIRLRPEDLTGILSRAIEHDKHFIYDETSDLYQNTQKIGIGWNAAATLWNGNESLGWLAADNGVKHQAATQALLETLALYALSVGTILRQKHAEKALRESEARYRLLADSISDMVIRLDLEANYRYVSPSCKSLLGYEPEEMVGRSGFDFIHPEDIAKIADAASRATAEQQAYIPMTVRFKHKEGYYVWVEITGRTVFSEHGQPLEFITSSRNVTRRKQAEDALASYADTVEDLYNNAPCGYHSLDAEGVIVNINNTELEWLGYERHEIVGKKKFSELLTEASLLKFRENFPKFKATGSVSDLEFELIRKDGSQFYVSLNATAIYDETGKYQMSRSTLFDITERHEIQQALEQNLAREKELSELKSRFVSTASHEFRTPLTIIQSSVDLLKVKYLKPGDAAIEARLNKISEQVKHLTVIIDEILNLGRLQSGAIVLNLVLTDMPTFCRSIMEQFENRPDIQHALEFLVEGDLPKIPIDTKLMRHVLNNLLSNAIKYSPTASPVSLLVEREADDLILRVKDRGIGIPDEDMERLFEPFHRAGNTGSIPGTGLGLSIAKQYIEMHGGKLEVESEVGRGTSMILRLPIPSET